MQTGLKQEEVRKLATKVETAFRWGRKSNIKLGLSLKNRGKERL